MSFAHLARQRRWFVASVLLFVGVLLVWGLAWLLTPGPSSGPEAVARYGCDPSVLTDKQALNLVRGRLAPQGYDAKDLDTLRVTGFGPEEHADWPSFLIYLEGTINGSRSRFGAAGNGCGLEQVFDFGSLPGEPRRMNNQTH